MNTRTRWIALGAVCAIAIGGAATYVVLARTDAQAQMTAAAPIGLISVESVLARDRVVFRSTALGETYGKLSVVPLDDPAGDRAVLDSNCERVYATATDGVCVTADRGIVNTYGITELDERLSPVRSSELIGLPSRARMSGDGSLISTTTFVAGHSYAETSFSTETIIRRDTGELVGNIEDFTTVVDGEPLTAVDRNYWGVTFVDDDTFYATAASTSLGTTWLVRGSLSGRSMESIRTDAECPSISPDRSRVAYKTRQGNPAPGQWRIAVLDLATGQETVLAEARSVDDQVEWLDDATVLYALPREGSEATTSDVWQVPADGTDTPTIFIPQAASPAVVRG